MSLNGLKYKIPVFAGLAALAGLLPTAVLTFEQNQWLELHVAYWTLLAMLCGWLLLAIRFIRANRFSLTAAWRRHAILLALSLTLAAVLFAAIPGEFRILSDETNLLSVSQSLYERRQPVVCLSGEYRAGRLECLQWRFDKRLHLYPFLVHLAHHATGFRPANAFAVNFLAGAGVLLCVGLIAGRLFDRAAAFAAPVLLASVPAVAQSFASGGSETVNLALLLLAALLLRRWSAAADRTLWGLLALTFALLCHVRLESPAYLLAGLPLIALRWRSPAHRADLCSWYSALAPLVFLPLAWHYALFADLEGSHTVDQVRRVEQVEDEPQQRDTATTESVPPSIDADAPPPSAAAGPPAVAEEKRQKPFAPGEAESQRRTTATLASAKISASLIELSRIFSGANLWRNTRKNLGFLFSADRALPNSAIVSTLAAIGLVGLVLAAFIRWKHLPKKAYRLCAAALPALIFLVCWGVFSSYWGGDLNEPGHARYSLPLWACLVFPAAWTLTGCGWLTTRLKAAGTALAAILAALLFFRNLPSLEPISRRQNSQLFDERRHLLAYLQRQSGNPLVVYDRSPETLLAGYDTWKPVHLLQHLDQLRRQLGAGQYTRVLFVWGMDCQNTAPVMAGVSYNTLCDHFLQQFAHQELARLVTERGHVILILDLRL